MKSLNTYISEATKSSIEFDTTEYKYSFKEYKEWEKKYKDDFYICHDDKLDCYVIFTKLEANKKNIEVQHVGTYNSRDSIFYYNPEYIKDIYPVD